jgi:hypothetical protein
MKTTEGILIIEVVAVILCIIWRSGLLLNLRGDVGSHHNALDEIFISYVG